MTEDDDQLLDQYSRHLLIEEIGYDGQKRLLSTVVAVEGSALWVPWAERYLRAAGLTVSAALADGKDGNRLVLRVAQGPVRELWLGDSFGAAMCRLGLELAALIKEMATAKGG